MTSSFTTGMAHMQNAIEEGKRRAEAAKSGGSGSSLSYINWKPGDKKILRFLTDDVIIEDFAEFIVDKTGNTKNFMIPPSDPTILERFRSASPGIGWRKNPKTQVLEDPKLRKVGVGLAVLRDERPNSETGQLEVTDYLYDQDIEGTKYLSRTFGIVQQSVSNFWHTLAVSCYNRFGTICDRDYIIERQGEGLNTKYSIIPMSAGPPNDPDLATKAAVEEFYFYGNTFDKDDPDRFLKCPQTLLQWAEYFSSEDRFKHWLVPDAGTPAPAQATYSPQATAVSQASTTPAWTQQADEAQASPMPSSATNFSSFKDTLLSKTKPQD